MMNCDLAGRGLVLCEVDVRAMPYKPTYRLGRTDLQVWECVGRYISAGGRFLQAVVGVGSLEV